MGGAEEEVSLERYGGYNSGTKLSKNLNPKYT